MLRKAVESGNLRESVLERDIGILRLPVGFFKIGIVREKFAQFCGRRVNSGQSFFKFDHGIGALIHVVHF